MGEFHKQDRVLHALHGPGVVVEADGRYTTIAFDGGGIRKFVSELVQLQPSDLPLPPPAPVRRPRRKKPLAKD